MYLFVRYCCISGTISLIIFSFCLKILHAIVYIFIMLDPTFIVTSLACLSICFLKADELL